MKFYIWGFTNNLHTNIKFHLNLTRKTRTLYEDLGTFMITPRWILIRMRYVTHKISRENDSTHFIFNFFFWKSCCLWDNVEKYGRARHDKDHNVLRQMRFACWITIAKNKHSECVTCIDLPRQQLLRERASMLRLYVICLLSKWFKDFSNVFTTKRSVPYSDWQSFNWRRIFKGNKRVRQSPPEPGESILHPITTNI